MAGFLRYTFMGALAGFILAAILDLPMLVILAAAAGGGLLPLFYVLRAKHKRLLTFEAQLPDALDLMGRALRAGHAFPSALKILFSLPGKPVSTKTSPLGASTKYVLAALAGIR